MVAVVCSFQSELRAMEMLMKKEIQFKSAAIEELIDYKMNNLEAYLCPAVALAVGSLTGQSDNRMISLAATFQYVFLAHHIHKKVHDDLLTESERQFPVLVGDFMFGQTFLKLCNKELFPYAGQFVKLIETINEGIVMRWRLKNKNIPLKDYRVIVGKERGAITALAGKLGAEFSGLQAPDAKKMEEFGYYLGMAWAAWDESTHHSLVQEFLAKAKGIIVELREHIQVKPLQELYDFFYREICSDTVLASIQ
jgi:geranylgeranyl pyrophosphate synthase